MNKAYQKLCTEFYDLSKPEAGKEEIAFYEKFVRMEKGPCLEAMCGSGRLLIPLLKNGFQIDGVDNSAEMLDSCAQRCKSENLKTNLFHQSLQNMSLPNKYGLIFIAIGSFQLIEGRSEAKQVLETLHRHLSPGGTLLIETYIPWDAIKECIDGSSIKDEAKIPYERKVSSPDGFEIVIAGMTTVKPKEQLEIGESRYRKMIDNRIIATEDEFLPVRWYYRYEMECLLEKCGFSDVKIWEESFELNPQAIIYQATKKK